MPAPPSLTKAIVNGVTPGHNAAHTAIERRFDMGGVANVHNVEEWGADFTGAVSGGAIANAAYAACAAAGGGIVQLSEGTLLSTVDLVWDANNVSVIGPGSTACTIQLVGTAKIVARPSTFTVVQGPKFHGFTVKGDAAAPANAIGIYTGDTTGWRWTDVVVRDFTGTNAVGVHIHNATDWTERNQFGFTIDNNTIGILVTTNGPADYSFEYNFWRPLRINVFAGQVGIVSRNNCFVRGGAIEAVGNITDNGTFMSIEGTSAWHMPANIMLEQTGGTGGQAFLQAAAAFRHFPGMVDVQTLTSNALAVPNNRVDGASIDKDPLTGLVFTPIAGFMGSWGNRPPTIAMLGRAGSSPPAAVVESTGDGTAHRFSVGTGTSPSAVDGQFFQVAFADAAPRVPRHVTVTCEGDDGDSALLGTPSVFNVTVFGYWVWVPNVPAASQPNTKYKYTGFVIL